MARTRLPRLVVPGLLGAAALLRLAYLLQNRHSPFFDHPIIDGWEYVARARVILEGGLLWDHVSIHAPLYPVFVAIVFAATGGSYLALYALQHALGLVTLLLVHRITERAFGGPAAIAALALAALSWVPVYYEGQPLSEPLAVFLLAAATFLLLRADEGAGWRRAAAAGAVLGLAVITRANALALVPLAAAWLATGRERRVARPAAFLGAVALAIVPVTVQNFRAEGDFVLIQANGGFNFYLAHNPDADGVHYLRPGYAWRRALREGERAAPEGPAARDRYWTRRALAYVAEEPGRTVALLGKRLVLFLSDCEIGTSEDPAWYRANFSALRWAPLGAGWATAIALLGIATWRRRDGPARPRGLLVLLLLGHVGTLLFFPYFSRYRYPGLVFVWALAGAGAAWISAWKVPGGRRRVALAAVLAALVAVSLADPLRLCPASIVRIEYQLGRVAAQRGDATAALAHFRAALAESPEDPDVLNNLGLVLDLQGRDDEARANYDAALARAPDHAEALMNLAALDRDEGRGEDALRGYEEAVRVEPGKSDAWGALGALYLGAGRQEEAIAAFQRAFELRPSDPLPAGNLGKVLLSAGRVDDAQAHFERIRKKRPTRVAGLLGLARCEAATGRAESAESLAREALRLDPANAEARRFLEDLRGAAP